MGGDIKGGGMSIYESNTQANPSLQYGEGLSVPNPSAHMELDQAINTGTYGKIKSYDRVIINNNIFLGYHIPLQIQCYSVLHLPHALRRL